MKWKMKSQKWIKDGLFKKLPTILPALFLLVLFGLIIGLSGTIKGAKARITAEKREVISKERPAANVVLLDVGPTTMLDRINLPGVIEPWEELSVLAKVQGTVIEMEVAEGDKVAKGQVIARIDPADFRIALDSAKATYELAAANQKRLAILFRKDQFPWPNSKSLKPKSKQARLLWIMQNSCFPDVL